MKKNSTNKPLKDQRSAIRETLYLLSIPGMRNSIRKGLKTSVKNCSSKISFSDVKKKEILK